MINNAIDFLISNTAFLKHGQSSYIDHCFNVFNILKENNCKEEVCVAGLLHSVYGTEFFNAGIVVQRDYIKNLIGEYAENLIYSFCNIEDRDYAILNNTLNSDFDQDLYQLANANLKSQSFNNPDPALKKLLNLYNLETLTMNNNFINTAQTVSHEHLKINNKDVHVFDNLLERHYVEALNDYCLGSSFKPNHGSSKFSYERDERFACYLNVDNFHHIQLEQVFKPIANFLQEDIYAGSYYINHYSHMAQNGRHSDSSVNGTFTALIFPNKFWSDTWGGELKFYNENGKFHYAVDFVPGRVLFFDSRIEHEVMPITINAKRSRFSIAIKCALSNATDYLANSFGSNNIVEIKHD